MLVWGAALGCGGTVDTAEPVANVAGSGARQVADPSTAGSVVGVARASGGESGAGSDSGAGGEVEVGGATAVHFWSEAVRHIEIACFGYFDGFAMFRADRAQLSAAQQAQLAAQTGVPGSTYDGNDDQIHCVVTTSEASNREQRFTTGPNQMIESTQLGEGGAGGQFAASVLGCEFHQPFETGTGESENGAPFLANPRCVREIWLAPKSGRYGLQLSTASKPYHVELIHCAQRQLGDTTVELFGEDLASPIAVASTPADPGPDQACLVLDAQVEAPVIGRLVFSSPSGKLIDGTLTFR